MQESGGSMEEMFMHNLSSSSFPLLSDSFSLYVRVAVVPTLRGRMERERTLCPILIIIEFLVTSMNNFIFKFSKYILEITYRNLYCFQILDGTKDSRSKLPVDRLSLV